MRFARYLPVTWLLLLVLAACSDGTRPDSPTDGILRFHGDLYSYDHAAVSLDTLPGRPLDYALTVVLSYADTDLATFRIRDAANTPAALLTTGEHGDFVPPAGVVLADVTGDSVAIADLGIDRVALVWTSIVVEEETFSGQGYLQIKERLDYACADSIDTAGGRVGPGDPAYDAYFETICGPGYYFPSQVLRFTCEEATVWWTRR